MSEQRKFIVTIPYLSKTAHVHIFAETAGKAKYQEWLSLRDCYPLLKLTDMRAYVAGWGEGNVHMQAKQGDRECVVLTSWK